MLVTCRLTRPHLSFETCVCLFANMFLKGAFLVRIPEHAFIDHVNFCRTEQQLRSKPQLRLTTEVSGVASQKVAWFGMGSSWHWWMRASCLSTARSFCWKWWSWLLACASTQLSGSELANSWEWKSKTLDSHWSRLLKGFLLFKGLQGKL